MKKSSLTRISLVAKENFKKKKLEMEKDLSMLRGRPVRVPLTRVIELSSTRPIFLDVGELNKVTRWRRK